MKIRWEFQFEATGVRFERVHKFILQISKEHTKPLNFHISELDVEITIEPNKNYSDPVSKQIGQIYIPLPGNKEQTKPMAIFLARYVAEQISFSQGKLKILGGLIMGEHLPENDEEAKSLGDSPYFAEMQLIEIPLASTFSGNKLSKVSGNLALIEQFNKANEAKSSIDKFLGLFKVLEGFYGPTTKKVTTAASLKASIELKNLALNHLQKNENGKSRKFTGADFIVLVDDLVKTRHKCAHLKPDGFGITYGHPDVVRKVEPLILALQILSYEAIQLRQ